tara:strand:+ start:218 stop:478 length:261 start_codon:yes stop_codon:yes gene_type:complete
MTHQTQYAGCPYVQLTFLPHGASRRRTVWAIREGSHVYRRAARDGGPWQKETATTVTEEVIIVTPEEATIRPAGVSLLYGWMEVLT